MTYAEKLEKAEEEARKTRKPLPGLLKKIEKELEMAYLRTLFSVEEAQRQVDELPCGEMIGERGALCEQEKDAIRVLKLHLNEALKKVREAQRLDEKQKKKKQL